MTNASGTVKIYMGCCKCSRYRLVTLRDLDPHIILLTVLLTVLIALTVMLLNDGPPEHERNGSCRNPPRGAPIIKVLLVVMMTPADNGNVLPMKVFLLMIMLMMIPLMMVIPHDNAGKGPSNRDKCGPPTPQ